MWWLWATLLAFLLSTPEGVSSLSLLTNRQRCGTAAHLPRTRRWVPGSVLLLQEQHGSDSEKDGDESDGDDDDDGWGTKELATTATTATDIRAALVQEKAAKKEEMAPNEEQRDLFIPIFTVVSLAGLFGAYGYEMVRLYLRGELYLPWT